MRKYLLPMLHQFLHKFVFFWHKNKREHGIVIHLSLTGETEKVGCLCNTTFWNGRGRTLDERYYTNWDI